MNDNMEYFTFCPEKKNFGAKNKYNLCDKSDYEPIEPFLYVPSLEEIKRKFEPKIAIPVRQINEDYYIKKLKEFMQKKEKDYINSLYIKKNKSSKNLLNLNKFQILMKDKINFDENMQKVDCLDDFEINIKNFAKKLFN